MKMFVGLGNPGNEYAGTRHNIGFEVVNYLSNKWDIHLNKSKFQGVFGVGTVDGESVLLVKPLTYMNLSGTCIRQLLDFYKIDLDDLVIIYDEMDFAPGQVKLRQRGSAAGHNGIRSTIQHLGTDEFNRIRMGIGRPVEKGINADFVLSPFHPDEIEIMRKAVIYSVEICEYWLKNDFVQTMNDYNRKDV